MALVLDSSTRMPLGFSRQEQQQVQARRNAQQAEQRASQMQVEAEQARRVADAQDNRANGLQERYAQANQVADSARQTERSLTAEVSQNRLSQNLSELSELPQMKRAASDPSFVYTDNLSANEAYSARRFTTGQGNLLTVA